MKVNLQEPAPLTQREAEQWINLLVYAAGDKLSPVARVLDVAYPTIRRWRDGECPTNWWYREVFRSTVELYVHHYRIMCGRTQSAWKLEAYQKRLAVIEKRLAALPADRYFLRLGNMDNNPQYREARTLLRRLLPPGQKVLFKSFIEEIRDNGISLRTLSRAAADLGVEKGRDGFQGASWWRRPLTEDDET